MIKKLLYLFFIIFIAGCASIGNSSFSSNYVKKDNIIFYQPKGSEFYDLKDKITVQEYKRLPDYLKQCYMKKIK